MVYVDEYESQVIVDSPPSVQNAAVTTEKSVEEKKEVLNYFWSFLSDTINKNFQTVQKVLSNYGIQAENPEQAVSAATGFFGTDKWIPFVKDIAPLLEEQKKATFIAVQQQKVSLSSKSKNNIGVFVLVIGIVLLVLGVWGYYLSKKTT